MATPAIDIKHLSKKYVSDKLALDDVSLKIMPGEIVAVIGASGAGKSSLLRHISCLTVADKSENSIRIFGQISQSNGRVSTDIRSIRRQVGFVHQQFNLVGRLDVLTNVLIGGLGRMPSWRTLARIFLDSEKLQALEALKRVDLLELAERRASTLSGGEQQRTAIARALMQRAKIVLADEPIASLDPSSAQGIMEGLVEINRNEGITIFVSLHQIGFALRYCPRTIALHRGRILYDGPSCDLTPDRLRLLYGATSEELLYESGVDQIANGSINPGIPQA